MVASAKLHKVQNAITNMLPYESQLHEILSRLLSDSRETESATGCEEFIIQRPVQKVAIIAVSSNSSLCGAFNANAIRHFRETAAKYAENGLSKEDILVFPIGRKMAEAVIKDGFMPQGDYNSLAEKHIYKDVSGFADNLIKLYLNGVNPLPEEVFDEIYKNSKGNSAFRKLMTRSGCSPNTFLKVRSALGSRYLIVFYLYQANLRKKHGRTAHGGQSSFFPPVSICTSRPEGNWNTRRPKRGRTASRYSNTSDWSIS